MTTTKTKQADSKAKKTIDELVKQDIDALRVRSKVSAGAGNDRCRKCGCMPTMF